jgi:hypothetical protein
MSDFLTRLVVHAGRALDVVRPRPVSRFEDPVSPAGAFGEEEISQPAAPPQSRGPFVTSGEQPEHGRAVPDTPATPSSTVVPELRTEIIDRVTIDRSPVPVPHHTVQAPQAAVARVPDRPQAARSEIARRDATHSITGVVEQVVRTEMRPPSHVPDTTLASHPMNPPRADRPPPFAPAPHRVPVVKPSAVSAAMDQRAASARPPVVSAAQGDVTVEITIGRVDVRAVLPQPPKARESQVARPELSLDEYLQQRGRRT